MSVSGAGPDDPRRVVKVSPIRKYLRAQAGGVDLMSSFLAGSLVDISREGFSVRTRRRPTVGREYACRLRHGGHQAEVVGRVEWCRLRETAQDPNGDVAPIYHAGLSLTCGDETSYETLLAEVMRNKIAG